MSSEVRPEQPLVTIPIPRSRIHLDIALRGSKYPMIKDFASKNHAEYGFWEPESSNIGYVDPLGKFMG